MKKLFVLGQASLAAAAFLSIVATVAFVGTLPRAQSQDSQAARSGGVFATCTHSTLHVAAPLAVPRDGEGRWVFEVLDPDDHVVGEWSRQVHLKKGGALPGADIAVPATLAVDDLVWHRLRYRLIYDPDRETAVEGIFSISEILRRPVVHVLSQRSYLAGDPAAVRLFVTERDNETAVTSGTVRVELLTPNQPNRVLYAGRLNERGAARALFRFPAGQTGKATLRYVVETDAGEADNVQEIRIENKVRILLTTEKPVYQPGQTIHVRALALDRASHHAIEGRSLTFEVEDSRGNKVFRKKTQTDAWGVASAQFDLADEVNLGTYHLRALPEAADESPDSAELALRVERYVLPKFKVALDLDGKDAKIKRGYRPGDHITGVVRSNYFFGKAVDHAEVTVKAAGMDVTTFDAGKSSGATDADGAFHFDIRLPDFFVGHPLNGNAAAVALEATVKDNAGHSEAHDEAITVSESPLLITAVPEGGAIVPGLDNQIFILASYPDGTPARAELQIQEPGGDQSVSTDEGGVCIIHVTGSERPIQLHVRAKDVEGNSTDAPVRLDPRPGADQILLRTEHAIYHARDPIRLQVFSTKSHGSAYVDVIKDGQTIATRDVEIERGVAGLNFDATPEMAGTVEFNAYVFGTGGRPIGDHRIVFVQPADDLRIATAPDAPVYKPGSDARIGFRVTNSRGEGVQAVLGVEAVDQAIFALAEKRPGFAKVFFYLEQELMKPRFEIHSLDLPETISGVTPLDAGERDRAARTLFAATSLAGTNNVNTSFGRDIPRQKYGQYAIRYASRLNAQAMRIADFLGHPGTKIGCGEGATLATSLASRMVDSWGNALRVDPFGRDFVVRSAGPDGKFNTADDLMEHLGDPACPGRFTAIRFEIRHNRGDSEFAAVSGRVTDMKGAIVAGATVQLTEAATGRAHHLKVGAEGNFHLASLTPGAYRLDASSPGFDPSVKDFYLEANDEGILSVPLNVGMVAETIQVEGAAAPIMAGAAGGLGGAPMNGRAFATMASVSGVMPKPGPVPADTHVRSWFPESLYVAPEIVTDASGRASITIPMADNITTWKMALVASTKAGALGSGSSDIKVFQDFFTEMDLPVTLTQGDEVSIPVAIYNYSGLRGSVRLHLDQAEWFSLNGDTPDKRLDVDSGRVAASQFTVAAKHIGKFRLTLRAELDGAAKRADIVIREIEVVPNGREQSMVFNGTLDSAVTHTVAFPREAIPEASTLFVRLYPGPLSQVIEGMESLLRMPYGCFEQTSSATYPNVLALGYMKRTKKATPEIAAKAEGFIAAGYQRLVTFEVAGGGFSWFGQAPANKILTSYGLMEFSDMSKVHDVDPRVIERTQRWLAEQQQADGSWKADTNFINEGATNRYNSDPVRITAYVAWALENTGYSGPVVANAARYLANHLDGSGAADAYTLAVLANFAVEYNKDPGLTTTVFRDLLSARKDENDLTFWSSEETSVYARGTGAAIETTGLALQALLKRGGDPAVVTRALKFIVSKKNANGDWGSTQATVMALRALLDASEKQGATAKGDVEVLVNGKTVQSLTLTADNNDLLHQFVIKDIESQAANKIELRFQGDGSMAYQVAGRYFTPWNADARPDPLSIDVKYDRTRLEPDQIATAKATVRNHLDRSADMVMIDLGIPPGFDLLTEDLDACREKTAHQKGGRLEKFTVTRTLAILYLDSIPARGEFQMTFRLRAKYPLRTRSFASRVYEYYAPEVNGLGKPTQLEVAKRQGLQASARVTPPSADSATLFLPATAN